MKTNMNFIKKCFMTFAASALFFAMPCFSGNQEFERLEHAMTRINSYDEMLRFYRTHKPEFEKWAGAAGATGGWGFFLAKGRPWGRKFLATFLLTSTMLAAGRFVQTEQ